MKILTLENANSIDQQMEEMIECSNMQGHWTLTVCDCYNNTKLIQRLIINEAPDVIMFMTTYTFKDRIKSLMELCQFVKQPLQLWDLNGAYMNDSIEHYIPSEYSHLFIVKQFNLLHVTSGIISIQELYDQQTKTIVEM